MELKVTERNFTLWCLLIYRYPYVCNSAMRMIMKNKLSGFTKQRKSVIDSFIHSKGIWFHRETLCALRSLRLQRPHRRTCERSVFVFEQSCTKSQTACFHFKDNQFIFHFNFVSSQCVIHFLTNWALKKLQLLQNAAEPHSKYLL